MIREDVQYYMKDPSRIESLIDDYDKNEKQTDEFIVEIHNSLSKIYDNTPYHYANYSEIFVLLGRIKKYIKANIEPYKDKEE